MTAAQANVEKRAERGPVIGLFVGLGLSAVGGASVVVCVWRLIHAFDEVKGPAIAAENKAKVLADGISGAMTPLAIGTGIAFVGMTIATVCAYQLYRRRREASL